MSQRISSSLGLNTFPEVLKGQNTEKRVVLHDLRVMSTALHLVCFSMNESQREYWKVSAELYAENHQNAYNNRS